MSHLCSPGVLHNLLVDESWTDEADQTAHGGSGQTQDGFHYGTHTHTNICFKFCEHRLSENNPSCVVAVFARMLLFG